MATLACYIAGLCKHDFVRGETGVLLCIAPDQRQAGIVLGHAGEDGCTAHPDVTELINDLITIGETAALAFLRGTRKLQDYLEPMALGLAEARRRHPADRDFGAWLKGSAFAEMRKDDRAALIKLGENWTDELAARIAEIPSSSPRMIWEEVSQIAKPETEENDDDDDDDGDDKDSGFYGSDRISRSNEAWDTRDPRLVKSLVEAVPGLKDRKVWEPAAGDGTMVDQLRASGVKVIAATDIEPRREDIAQLDLLTATEMPAGTDASISNPPWGRLAAPFVRHVLKLAEQRQAMVAMLLPLPWITGRKVADLTGSPGFEELIVPRYRARWMTEEEEAELDDALARTPPCTVAPLPAAARTRRKAGAASGD
jgi:hypothetical protein